MDPTEQFAASRLVIVAGKGGVGKTTVTAALARAVSRRGRSVLVVEVEGKSGLSSMFDRPALTYDELVLADAAEGHGEIRARTITPDAALLEYLRNHGLSRVSKRLVNSGALDVVATAAPGIRDILVLGKVKQLQRAGAADLLLLDAPAAGHAITFLRSARAIEESVKVGPINTQAREVLELLGDHERCQVILVTLPEETPVNELVETAFSLEDKVGVGLGPIVVNGVYPNRPGLDVAPDEAARHVGVDLAPDEAEALAEAARFRRDRVALQREQIDRLAERLPLPQLHLPFLFEGEIGTAQLDILAAHLLEGLAEVEAR